MSYQDRYQKLSLAQLVRIVESADDYQAGAVEAAKEEIKRRRPEPSELLQSSRAVLKERIERYLNDFSVVNDQLVLQKSHYMNEEEVKLLFRSCFAEWKKENDDMIPDSWLYVLGAGFG